MIEVKNLSKQFGETYAVKDVSFALEKGETLALVGTSGSGKTTTLKLINRLIEPTQGNIFVNGEDVMALPIEQMRRKMGYVIQNIGLFPHYTIAQNVGIVPKLLKWENKEILDRTLFLLERLKLDAKQFIHKYPHQLSGGQQQRVGIARALAAKPPIILMDEPFGALDPITRYDIQKDFLELEELATKTTIIVTHDIEEAFLLGDKICILDHGYIQQLGSPKEILFSPANDFVKQFLADKKLDLLLQVLNVEDIFEFLPISKKAPEGKVAVFFDLDLQQSIKESIDHLSNKPYGTHFALSEKNGIKKAFDLSDLMDAFHSMIN
ncbi:MAG: ATP-binding cassette domain-containing protein [Bacteroidota bacterium]